MEAKYILLSDSHLLCTQTTLALEHTARTVDSLPQSKNQTKKEQGKKTQLNGVQ